MAIKGALFHRPLTIQPTKPISCLIFRTQQQRRQLHARIPTPPVPPPTPFVPDTHTFLTLIGRNLAQHAAKFASWDALFTLTSPQLRALGIEPPRARRYLLRWREKFRHGEFGAGGSLQNVKDGVAEVRLVEVPGVAGLAARAGAGATITKSPGMKKIIVNVEGGIEKVGKNARDVRRTEGLRILHGTRIAGPYAQLVKGAGGKRALVKVREGMWEHRRGQKVDGGERRKSMVRAKRRSQERKDNETE